MSFTQTDVTKFYDSLVFPSRVRDSVYSRLAAEVIQDGWRVGDFGCGQSLFYSAFHDLTSNPVFLDISLNALKTIDYGVKIRADVCQIPLKDEIFDAVFCIGVLHHLPDMDSALTELSRVLVSGGILIIGVYSSSSLGARLKHLYDAANSPLVRNTTFYVATILLWAKLRTQFKLSWEDARKRISDLLDTPIVRYLPPEYFERMAARSSLTNIDRRKISNMIVLFFKKDSEKHPEGTC